MSTFLGVMYALFRRHCAAAVTLALISWFSVVFTDLPRALPCWRRVYIEFLMLVVQSWVQARD